MSMRSSDWGRRMEASGWWWHSTALTPAQMMGSKDSVNPRSASAMRNWRSIPSSLMPGRKRVSRSPSNASLAAAERRMASISAAHLTARMSPMCLVTLTILAFAKVSCRGRNWSTERVSS